MKQDNNMKLKNIAFAHFTIAFLALMGCEKQGDELMAGKLPGEWFVMTYRWEKYKVKETDTLFSDLGVFGAPGFFIFQSPFSNGKQYFHTVLPDFPLVGQSGSWAVSDETVEVSGESYGPQFHYKGYFFGEPSCLFLEGMRTDPDLEAGTVYKDHFVLCNYGELKSFQEIQDTPLSDSTRGMYPFPLTPLIQGRLN